MILEPTDNIIQELYEKPLSFKGFIKKNINGILATLIFHLLIFILLLGIKISSYKGIDELGIMLDFEYKPEDAYGNDQLTPEEVARLELLERFLQSSLRASNQAVNISEQLDKEISTDNFVNQVRQELDEMRTEEERKELEIIEQRLSKTEIHDDFEETFDAEDKSYDGPTRISYEFFAPPYNRQTAYLPVPIYKCQGSGVVEVEIQVDRSGRVVSAKPSIVGSPPDGQCLAEAAVRYALLSRFSKPYDAPPTHKGKITYSFVAQ